MRHDIRNGLWILPIAGIDHIVFGDFGVVRQLKASPFNYGENYFNHYVELYGTGIARQINCARVNLCRPYTDRVLDIGVGALEFIDSMNKAGLVCHGYDVNPIAEQQLKERGCWADPYEDNNGFDDMSFWDVLQHFPDPMKIIDRVNRYLFTSLPIFDSIDQIRMSKHFKPNEHLWYFTRSGFVFFMEQAGFSIVEYNESETLAGRESIGSFVFLRIKPPKHGHILSPDLLPNPYTEQQ